MTDTTLTDSLAVQNDVVSTAIDVELELQPLTEALNGSDYRIVDDRYDPTIQHTERRFLDEFWGEYG
jgi:TATA-box binding protein (TBP) (component of TFIID and TFIIIB)